MVLKKGSRGDDVKALQQFLEIAADGIFGNGTDKAVRKWQFENNLTVDGIVGKKTWNAMGMASTDNSEKIYTTSNGLVVEKYFLPTDEYMAGPTKKEYCFWISFYQCYI